MNPEPQIMNPKPPTANLVQGVVSVSCLTHTLHSTPYTLHHTSCTLHSTSFTFRRTSFTPHPTPYTLHPTLYTLHLTPYTLHLIHEGEDQAARSRTPRPTPTTPECWKGLPKVDFPGRCGCQKSKPPFTSVLKRSTHSITLAWKHHAVD